MRRFTDLLNKAKGGGGRKKKAKRSTTTSLHLSFNRVGRWGTRKDFTTSFLNFSLFSTAFWDLALGELKACQFPDVLFLTYFSVLLDFFFPLSLGLGGTQLYYSESFSVSCAFSSAFNANRLRWIKWGIVVVSSQRSGLTVVSRHSEKFYQGNELTRISSVIARPLSSELSEPQWHCPWPKRLEVVRCKKRKAQAGNDSSNLASKSLHAKKKATNNATFDFFRFFSSLVVVVLPRCPS